MKPVYVHLIFCPLCLAGILSNGKDEFEDVNEIYEAIGEVLHEVSQEKTESDIKDICERLLGK